MTEVPPDAFFHIATPGQWAAAQLAGEVAPPSLAEEGFVHCSTSEQLAATIERHYRDHDELVLLRLDPAAVADALVWEEGRPGEEFPHVYRPLRVPHDVAGVVPWQRPG